MAWALGITGISAMIGTIFIPGSDMAPFLLIGGAILALSMIFPAFGARIARPGKITKEHTQLAGICKEILDDLPRV